MRCAGRPIARSTCDGSSVPDEHAEPVETAIPSRSSAISRLSASTRSKLMFVVFGTRRSRAPFTAVPGTAARMPSSSRSRSAADARAFARQLAARERAATPRPTMAGTFSVPARRFRSCLPPVRIGCMPRAALDPQRAGALRPVELVRRQRQQIDAERADVDRNLARPTARRRCASARRARARSRRARRSAESCRSRCSRASPTRAPCRRRSPRAGDRATTMPESVDRERASSASRGAPAPCSVLSTASCSIALAIRWRRPVGSSASAAPRIAKLSDSVPPLVKTISDGSALISAATADPRLVERRLRLLAEVMNARRVAEQIACRATRRRRRPRAKAGVVAL